MDNLHLRGWNAVVTGGGSGMGAAIAFALAKSGANVAVGSLLRESDHPYDASVISHLPSQQDFCLVEKKLRSVGVEAISAPLDVTKTASIDALFDQVYSKWGSIDILVTAAGISIEHALANHPLDSWHKVIDVNLTGTALCIRRALPCMLEKKRGRIVTIASTAANVGAPRSGAYCASKAGVVALTRCVALEAAASNITCNAISPSWVDTPLAKQWMNQCAELENTPGGAAGYRQAAERANPQGRLIQPDEVAALVVFLCSSAAQGITGQEITVSGGSLW